MAEVRSANYPGNLYTCKYEFRPCVRNSNGEITGYATSLSTGTVSIVADDPDSITEEVYRLLGVSDWINSDPNMRVSSGILSEYTATFTGKVPVDGDRDCDVVEIVRKDAANSKAVVATRIVTVRPGEVTMDPPRYFVSDKSSTDPADWRDHYFQLNWQPPQTGDPVAYYTIYRTDPNTSASYLDPNIQVGTSLTNESSIEDIDSPGDYLFAVTANNAGGSSAKRQSIPVTVPETHYTIYGALGKDVAAEGSAQSAQISVFLDQKLEFVPSTFKLGTNGTSSIGYNDSNGVYFLRNACFKVTVLTAATSSTPSTVNYYTPTAVWGGNFTTSTHAPTDTVSPGFFNYTLQFDATVSTAILAEGAVVTISLEIDGYTVAGNGSRVSILTDDQSWDDSNATLYLDDRRGKPDGSTVNNASFAAAFQPGEPERAIGPLSTDPPHTYAMSSTDSSPYFGAVTYPYSVSQQTTGTYGTQINSALVLYVKFSGVKFGISTDPVPNNNISCIGISRKWDQEAWSNESRLYLVEYAYAGDLPDGVTDPTTYAFQYGSGANAKYYVWSSTPDKITTEDQVSALDDTEKGRCYSNGQFGYNRDSSISLTDDYLWLKQAFSTTSQRIQRSLTYKFNLYGPGNFVTPVLTKSGTVAFPASS